MLGDHEGVTQNTASPEVNAAHLHRLANGDRLRPNRRDHTERDGEGVDEYARQVKRTQRRFHLADPRRAVHVEGEAKAREETREPERDRTACADREDHATRRGHGLEPRDEEGRAEADCVADEAPEPGARCGGAAHLPQEGKHREQLHHQKRGCGARAHDERVEDEEGEELGARIQPAR